LKVRSVLAGFMEKGLCSSYTLPVI